MHHLGLSPLQGERLFHDPCVSKHVRFHPFFRSLRKCLQSLSRCRVFLENIRRFKERLIGGAPALSVARQVLRCLGPVERAAFKLRQARLFLHAPFVLGQLCQALGFLVCLIRQPLLLGGVFRSGLLLGCGGFQIAVFAILLFQRLLLAVLLVGILLFFYKSLGVFFGLIRKFFLLCSEVFALFFERFRVGFRIALRFARLQI